jgi:hypothetical protein
MDTCGLLHLSRRTRLQRGEQKQHVFIDLDVSLVRAHAFSEHQRGEASCSRPPASSPDIVAQYCASNALIWFGIMRPDLALSVVCKLMPRTRDTTSDAMCCMAYTTIIRPKAK